MSLQYCKLKRKVRNLPRNGWVDDKKATDCNYQEYDIRLKEQFINGLNVETIIAEIIKELTTLSDTSEVASEQVLMWAQRVEAQRA